jgi:hypothetical protein
LRRKTITLPPLSLESGTAGNNGNLLGQTITGQGLSASAVQSYEYDQANRPVQAIEGAMASPAWRRGFDYDRYGNGWVSDHVNMAPAAFTPVAPTNYGTDNRLYI